MPENYPGLEESKSNLEVIEDVCIYLGEDYVERLNQGPVWLTGSSLHVADPGDYDLVVQRDFQEVPKEADQIAAANVLNEFQQEEIDYGKGLTELNKQLEASEYVETGKNVNLYPEPVRRFQMKIQDISVDLSFNNDRPVDEALKLFE